LAMAGPAVHGRAAAVVRLRRQGSDHIAKEDAELLDTIGYAPCSSRDRRGGGGVAAVRVFGGPPEWPRDRIHEAPWRMILPPLLLALIGIEFEFLPDLADPLLAVAAQAMAPELGAWDVQASYVFARLTATELTLLIGWRCS